MKLFDYIKSLFTGNTLATLEDRLRKDLADMESVISAKREQVKALAAERDNINKNINQTMNEIERADDLRTTISKTLGDKNERV